MIPFSESDLVEMSGGRGRNLNDLIIRVMQEFHYDIDTMRKMPIPTFIELVRKLNEDAKEMEKSSKR